MNFEPIPFNACCSFFHSALKMSSASIMRKYIHPFLYLYSFSSSFIEQALGFVLGMQSFYLNSSTYNVYLSQTDKAWI